MCEDICPGQHGLSDCDDRFIGRSRKTGKESICPLVHSAVSPQWRSERARDTRIRNRVCHLLGHRTLLWNIHPSLGGIFLAAPLLLLRSDQSAALSTKWFSASLQRDHELENAGFKEHFRFSNFRIGLLITVISSALLSYAVARYWTLDQKGLLGFSSGVMVGTITLHLSCGFGAAAAARYNARVSIAIVIIIVGTLAGALGVAAASASIEALAGLISVGTISVLITITLPNYPGHLQGLYLRSLAIRFALQSNQSPPLSFSFFSISSSGGSLGKCAA